MTADDAFDWSNDPSVLVPAQMAIAIYSNRDGNVVLRQERDVCDEDDSFVWVRPEFVVSLAEAMLHEAGIEATINVASGEERLLLPKPDHREHRSVLTGETLPLPLDGAAAR